MLPDLGHGKALLSNYNVCFLCGSRIIGWGHTLQVPLQKGLRMIHQRPLQLQ
jgi:hypothetical protein